MSLLLVGGGLHQAAPSRAQAAGGDETEVEVEGLNSSEADPESAESTASSSPSAVPSAAPPSAAEQEARQHFDRAEAFFANENYAAALVEYTRAHRLLEGNRRQHFMLYNIGLCHERLFQYTQAIDQYERYLADAPADAEDRATVAASVRTLRNMLGTLRVRSNRLARVWSQDRELGASSEPILLPPGTHVLEVRAEGYDSERIEVQIASREEQEVRVELSELVEGVSPAFFVVTASAAALTLGTAAYFGIRALKLNSEAESRGPGDPSVALDRAPIENAALAHDILLGVGVALGVGATVLLIFTDWGGDDEQVAVQPNFGPGYAGLSIGGTL